MASPIEQLLSSRPANVNLVGSIVEQIETVIIEQKLNPGDKLPPSRELQKLLGTSQGTLREAIGVLKQKGLVEPKAGRKGGLYVRAVSSDAIGESLSLLIRQRQVSLKHLAVFRSSLEVSAASLATIEAKKKDISHLNVLMKNAKVHLAKGISEWNAFYKVEDQMHHLLARMTKNPLFESVLITVYRNNPGYNSELIPVALENMEDTYADWLEMIDAIKNRRPDKAGWIMTKHIQRFLPSMTT